MRVFGRWLVLLALVPALGISIPVPSSASQATAGESSRMTLTVRVWDQERFVDRLGLADFALRVDGRAVPVDGLRLVEKTSIVRSEGRSEPLPDTSRRFYWLFQAIDPIPRLGEAIAYFFERAYLPGDSLTVQTPLRTYTLSASALASKPRAELAREMNEIVRRDVTEGAMAYKNYLTELKKCVRAMGEQNPMADFEEGAAESLAAVSEEQLLERYRMALAGIENLCRVDEAKILGFARTLGRVPGRKVVLYFYQREFRPEISPIAINLNVDNNHYNFNPLGSVNERFQVYRRTNALNAGTVSRAFAQAGVDFNLLFMNRQPERVGGLVMREQTEDALRAFSEACRATGGIVAGSQSAETAVKEVLEACSSYYLLSFDTGPGRDDEAFRGVNISVGAPGLRITSPSGFGGKPESTDAPHR